MDYKSIGNQIMNLDPKIRFVTIIDINDGMILFSEHGPGVTNLLTKEATNLLHLHLVPGKYVVP